LRAFTVIVFEDDAANTVSR